MFTSTLILATFANIFLHTKCCLKIISTDIEGNGYIVAFVSTPTSNETASFNASLLDLLQQTKGSLKGKACKNELGIIVFNVCNRETTLQAVTSSLLDRRFVNKTTGESVIFQYVSYLPKKYNEILLQFAFSEEITFYTPHEMFVTYRFKKSKTFLDFNYTILMTFIETLKWQSVALLHIYNDYSYLDVNSLWRELKQRYPTLCITYYTIHGNNETHMIHIVKELNVNTELEVIFGIAETDLQLLMSPMFITNSTFVNFLNIANKQELRNKTWFWNYGSGIMRLFTSSGGYKKNVPRNLSAVIDGTFVYDMSISLDYDNTIFLEKWYLRKYMLKSKAYKFMQSHYQYALDMSLVYCTEDIKDRRSVNRVFHYISFEIIYGKNVYFRFNSTINLYVLQEKFIFTGILRYTIPIMVSHYKWGNRLYKPPKSLCSKKNALLVTVHQSVL